MLEERMNHWLNKDWLFRWLLKRQPVSLALGVRDKRKNEG